MRIIPDSNKVTYLVDSHPDTPEDADYLEVSECDTIEITDKELDDIGQAYNIHVETYMNSCDLLSEALRQIKPFSKYLKELIELKMAGEKNG